MSSLPRLLQSAWNLFSRLLTDLQYFKYLALLVVLGDAFLTQLIIRFVPCQQVLSLALTPS